MRRRSVSSAIFLGLNLLCPVAAEAGACGSYLAVVSLGPKLPRNGAILLETSRDIAAVQQALPTARFVTASASVGVRLLYTLQGGRLQVLLAPASDLPVDTAVRLELGIPELDAELARFTLSTSAAVDTTTPTWLKAPAAGRHDILPSHKGDWVDAYRVHVPLGAPAFVLAKLQSKNETALAIYPAATGDITIGITGCHSMLGADAARGTVQVTLTAIGASGHVANAPGKPLQLRF